MKIILDSTTKLVDLNGVPARVWEGCTQDGVPVHAYITLEWVALFHAAGAFVMLAFLISHLYLITAGPTLTSHLKAMITGWDEH